MKIEVDEDNFNKVREEYEALKGYISFNNFYAERVKLLKFLFEGVIIVDGEKSG